MRQHSSAGRLGGSATCVPWASTSSSNGWLPRVVLKVFVRVQMRVACVWASRRTPSRAAAWGPVSRTSVSSGSRLASATDSRGLSYTSPAQAVTRVTGKSASVSRMAWAICQPARPAPTMTTPALAFPPTGRRRLAPGALVAAVRSRVVSGGEYSEKSVLVTAHSGQTQSSGMSANRVPGGRPLSGSPLASS